MAGGKKDNAGKRAARSLQSQLRNYGQISPGVYRERNRPRGTVDPKQWDEHWDRVYTNNTGPKAAPMKTGTQARSSLTSAGAKGETHAVRMQKIRRETDEKNRRRTRW